MRSAFLQITAQMEPLLQSLQSSSPHTVEDGLQNPPREGVYAFYESGKAIHVGRSNRMASRIREHRARNSKRESATFAYKLMQGYLREQGGHSSPLTRKKLQDLLSAEYKRQKTRIREMDVRAVATEDQAVQAIFDIFAILALGTTEYNSFQTT